ncbi:hypothetical protein [Legionella tunisiensis]|uniref:hypothetical protein n=1 Tax=Legionella tunisiensis TaxID=1034944 RepID=UPI0002DEEDB0|nr:hypothetical protein [Legionella tunisiensis]
MLPLLYSSSILSKNQIDLLSECFENGLERYKSIKSDDTAAQFRTVFLKPLQEAIKQELSEDQLIALIDQAPDALKYFAESDIDNETFTTYFNTLMTVYEQQCKHDPDSELLLKFAFCNLFSTFSGFLNASMNLTFEHFEKQKAFYSTEIYDDSCQLTPDTMKSMVKELQDYFNFIKANKQQIHYIPFDTFKESTPREFYHGGGYDFIRAFLLEDSKGYRLEESEGTKNCDLWITSGFL